MIELISSQLGYAISILLVVCTTIYLILYHYAYYIYNKIPDDKLFQDPPPKEDCPICLLPMPYADGICGVRKIYMSCCGKRICTGCSKAEDEEMVKGNIKAWCACCRVPLHSTDEELIERLENRMDLNDADAFFNLGTAYYNGSNGLPKDYDETFELWNEAADLGSCQAHHSLVRVYYDCEGKGVPLVYMNHMKLAAIGGHELARYYLGLTEEQIGNMYRAMKHFMIAARCGDDESLKKIGEGYKAGHVTKEDYTSTLSAYQLCANEMKSKQRTKVAQKMTGIRRARLNALKLRWE